MKTRLNELKGRMADRGRAATWDQIAEATGIRKGTLIALGKGELKQIRPEYIDALCTYYSQMLEEDVHPGVLLVVEPVKLPLALNIRPDRHGKRVGEH